MSEAVPTLARIEIRCETANSEFAGIVQETCRSKLYAGSRLYDSKRWQAAAETAGLAREISGYFSSKHLYQHLRTEPPQTIYLCGVPGVGKSTVLQNALGRLPFPAVRGDLSEIVVSASGTEIADDYVSMALKDLVYQARSATPSVLFVDNFDVLADSEQSESITDLASHIVKFIEGIPDGVVLVIESSVGDAELPVSIRRCNALQHRVTISVPRLWQRREIVRSVIDDMLKGSSDIEALVGQVANVTAGYVARDITALCRQAALR
ncbi:AAA+-type ATPase, partial [Coemansia sp. RSA 1824]